MTLAAHFRSEEWSHAELAREVNRLLENSGLSRPHVSVRFHDHERSYRELAEAVNSLLKYKSLIIDPGFDDPSAWTIAGTGGAVTGSQLVITNPFGMIASQAVMPTVGTQYNYRIEVSASPGAPLVFRALFGGVTFWDKAGVGTVEGTLTATAAASIAIQATFAGLGTIDYLSIQEINPRRVPVHFETPEKSYRVLYEAVRMLQ